MACAVETSDIDIFRQRRSMAEWFQSFRLQPTAMKKAVKALCHCSEISDIGCNKRCKEENVPAATWICDGCDKCSTSKRALSVHAIKVHGQKSELRKYIDDACVCPVCNKLYGSRVFMNIFVAAATLISKERRI